MKKQLLTLAVLGTVAMGGAVSQVSAGTYYTNNGHRYICNEGDISCADAIGNQAAWDNATDVGGPNVVDPDLLRNEDFTEVQ